MFCSQIIKFVPKFCTGTSINVLVFKNLRLIWVWAVNHLKLWQRHIPRHLYGVEPVVPLVTNITHRITNWKQTESGWGGQAFRWTYSFLSQCSTIGCPWGSIGGPWDRMLWWWVWKQKCLIEDFVCLCVCIEGTDCVIWRQHPKQSFCGDRGDRVSQGEQIISIILMEN